MTEDKFRKVLKEVYVILNASTYEVINRIPSSLKEFIINNMDDNYDYKIKIGVSLAAQEMMDKTKEILDKIYCTYLTTET